FYHLVASKEGKITIPPAKIKVKNKTLESNSITIEVVKGNAATNSHGGNTNNSTTVKGDNKDVFIKIFLNKNKVFIGDQVIATFKLYSKYPIRRLLNPDPPGFNGFFKEDISEKGQIALERENINGQNYYVAKYDQYVLYPQKSGDLVIGETGLSCIVSKPYSHPFWGTMYKEVEEKAKSKNNTSIKVLPLPPGRPGSFQGAVGKFQMEATVDNNQVKTNDPVVLKINIKGNGNLNLLEIPNVKFPPDVEVFEPEVKVNVKNTISGSTGSKSFEYVLVPRYAGEYTIPPIEFSYFDIASKSYKTIKSDEFRLTVEKGEEGGGEMVVTGPGKRDIKYISQDIKHIKTKPFSLYNRNLIFFGSLNHYLFYLIPLGIFLAGVGLTRNRIKRNSNVKLVRNKKANKLARKRLQVAHSALKNNQIEKFYEETLKSMWGYLSDKLGIPISSLSKEKAGEELIAGGISKDIVDKYNELIDNCEFARYAPASDKVEPSAFYEEVVNTLSKIEQNMKKT
ncbi:MAG: BatD family protein, partial [bacterium]